MENNKIRICFGSKALFNKQFHIEENKYKSHNQWKDDWIRERNSQFFCIGSKDESSGNQTCTYSSNGDLRLRVPGNFESDYGKYIVFENISFPYGQEKIHNAIKTYVGETKGGKPVKYCNSSIGYKFMKNAHGWYINATVETVKDIVKKAVLKQIPIAIEELDFSKKKAILGEESKKYSRMLSGFSYSKFKYVLKSRASKHGVEIIEVDPAYTSVIGQI